LGLLFDLCLDLDGWLGINPNVSQERPQLLSLSLPWVERAFSTAVILTSFLQDLAVEAHLEGK
jgi:hypothetical protein